MTPISQRDALILSLPKLQQLIRGSLIRQVHDHCRCHPNGRYIYWYLSINQKGKTQTHKLKDQQVSLVRQALKDYNRWWKTCLKIFELNTHIALSEEA